MPITEKAFLTATCNDVEVAGSHSRWRSHSTGNLANNEVSWIREEHVSVGIYRNAERSVQRHSGGKSAIRGDARRDAPGYCVDFSGELGSVISGPYDSDKVRRWRGIDGGRRIADQTHIDVILRIDEDIPRTIQQSTDRGITIRGDPWTRSRHVVDAIRSPRERIDVAGGGKCAKRSAGNRDANGIVTAVRDIEVAARVEGAAVRKVQVGASHGAVVAAIRV